MTEPPSYPEPGSAPAYPPPAYPPQTYPAPANVPAYPPPSSPPVYPAVGHPGQPHPASYGYPAYVAPAPKPAFPHDRPRPYHQMLRTWTYAPWKSVVGIVVLLGGFLIAVPILALPVLFIAVAFQSGDYLDNITDAATLERVTPAAMLYLNATLGGAILLTWLIIRLLHGMRPRWLSSVVPKLRWNFLYACLGVSVAALAIAMIVGALLPSSSADAELGELNTLTASYAMVALVILLTTPFQAAGRSTSSVAIC